MRPERIMRRYRVVGPQVRLGVSWQRVVLTVRQRVLLTVWQRILLAAWQRAQVLVQQARFPARRAARAAASRRGERGKRERRTARAGRASMAPSVGLESTRGRSASSQEKRQAETEGE